MTKVISLGTNPISSAKLVGKVPGGCLQMHSQAYFLAYKIESALQMPGHPLHLCYPIGTVSFVFGVCRIKLLSKQRMHHVITSKALSGC